MSALAIFGSRDVDLAEVRAVVFPAVAATAVDVAIVSGGATGVDTEARRAAEFYRRPYDEKRAEWRRYGNRAGFLRNRDIEAAADDGLCVWNGTSRGSLHTRALFHGAKKPVKTITVSKRVP